MQDVFLEELSKPQPNPGGGAAAAHGGLLALAILEKVVRLELGRHSRASDASREWLSLLDRLLELSGQLLDLRQEDVRAYLAFSEVRASGRKGVELLAAVERAIRCPVLIMERAREILVLLLQAGRSCKKHLVSDLLVACEFMGASLRGAYHIACANTPLLVGEDSRCRSVRRSIESTRDEACQELLMVSRALLERIPTLSKEEVWEEEA